jgi:hypothetical protein
MRFAVEMAYLNTNFVWRWTRSPDRQRESRRRTGRTLPAIRDPRLFCWGENHVFDATFKNNLASDNRSSFEVNWAFPLAQHLRGYVQFFTGYGENMIDMENNNTRIGVGIALTDWL